jgi:hypothetical protein
LTSIYGGWFVYCKHKMGGKLNGEGGDGEWQMADGKWLMANG